MKCLGADTKLYNTTFLNLLFPGHNTRPQSPAPPKDGRIYLAPLGHGDTFGVIWLGGCVVIGHGAAGIGWERFLQGQRPASVYPAEMYENIDGAFSNLLDTSRSFGHRSIFTLSVIEPHNSRRPHTALIVVFSCISPMHF